MPQSQVFDAVWQSSEDEARETEATIVSSGWRQLVSSPPTSFQVRGSRKLIQPGLYCNELCMSEMPEIDSDCAKPQMQTLPAIPSGSDGFHDTLQAVREQLLQLSTLVDVLSAQHENAVAATVTNSKRRLPAMRPAPPGATGDVDDEQRQPVCRQSLGPLSQTMDIVLTPPMQPPLQSDVELKRCSQVYFDTETMGETIQAAIEADDFDKVRKLLADGIDPNLPLGELTQSGLTLLSGTPLILALLRQNTRIIGLLLNAQADPLAEYSFPAGAEQITWVGSAVHATMPSGNLSALQELVSYSAELEVSSSNGATLVWQAAYFGHATVLQFLMESGLDKEAKAISQDDSTLTHSPLHIASKMGNMQAVAVLLEAKASYSVEDGSGISPLHDAVCKGHAGVVQLLVTYSADIFRPGPPARRDQDMHAARCIDIVFESNNHALMGAVARALQDVPRLSPLFTRADLIRFISSPGDAPVDIWDAVFRRVSFKSWELHGDRLMRVVTSAAYVDYKTGMGIALGPDKAHIQDYFMAKAVLPEALLSFKDRLTRITNRQPKDLYMPVTFYVCHLPFIHEDLEVILAIADCEDQEVFSVPACRAIVSLKWAQERMGAQFRMIMAFVEVMNLVLINILLNGDSEGFPLADEQRERLLFVASLLAFAVWVAVSLLETAQAIGYFSHGLVRRYISNFRYVFDFAVLCLTCVVISWVWTRGMETVQSPAFRIMLGFVVGLKWARFLVSLRQLKSVGLRILPIMDTMWDVGPFLFVLSVYFLGAVNMLYALGNHTSVDAFLVIYRLVVLGDVHLGELETGSALSSFRMLPDGRLQQEGTPLTDYRYVVRCLMLVVSFLMGVSMMNLFVAMLCVSYSAAAERAPLAFERSRAHIVLDQYAARKGFMSMLCIPWWTSMMEKRRATRASVVVGGNRDGTLPATPVHTWDNLKVLMETSLGRDQLQQSAYVWFSTPSWTGTFRMEDYVRQMPEPGSLRSKKRQGTKTF